MAASSGLCYSSGPSLLNIGWKAWSYNAQDEEKGVKWASAETKTSQCDITPSVSDFVPSPSTASSFLSVFNSYLYFLNSVLTSSVRPLAWVPEKISFLHSSMWSICNGLRLRLGVRIKVSHTHTSSFSSGSFDFFSWTGIFVSLNPTCLGSSGLHTPCRWFFPPWLT